MPRTALFKRNKSSNSSVSDPLELVLDLREHDVTYLMRASIDCDIRIGNWYTITPVAGSEVCEVVWQQDYQERGEPKYVRMLYPIFLFFLSTNNTFVLSL